MRSLSISLVLVFTLVLTIGDTGQAARASTQPERTGAAVAATPLEAAIGSAEREYGVPQRVLLALSYVESLWDAHDAKPSFWNGYGPFHLQDNPNNDSLPAAAALLRLPVDAFKGSIPENARGAAALLREAYVQIYPNDAALTRAGELGRWYRPVAAYHRTDKLAAQRNHADTVFSALQRGASRVVNGQRIELPPTPSVVPDRGNLARVPSDQERAQYFKATREYQASLPGFKGPKLASPLMMNVQHGADSWFPLNSPNYTPGFPFQMVGVVIHTCQGDSVSCQSTLVNDSVPLANRVSAHWLVYSGNGWREQFVHVEDRSWHCGFCPAAQPWGNWNNASVGIEHEGFVDNPAWYTPVMYKQSAWLTAFTCYYKFFGCDRNHVIGHDEVEAHGDPGPNWDWNWYMLCVVERMDYLNIGVPPSQCL